MRKPDDLRSPSRVGRSTGRHEPAAAAADANPFDRIAARLNAYATGVPAPPRLPAADPLQRGERRRRQRQREETVYADASLREAGYFEREERRDRDLERPHARERSRPSSTLFDTAQAEPPADFLRQWQSLRHDIRQDLKADLQRLEERLAAVSEPLPDPRLDAIRQGIDELSTRLAPTSRGGAAAIERRLDVLSDRVAGLARTVEGLSTGQPAGAAWSALRAEIAKLTERLEADRARGRDLSPVVNIIEGGIADLRSRIETIRASTRVEVERAIKSSGAGEGPAAARDEAFDHVTADIRRSLAEIKAAQTQDARRTEQGFEAMRRSLSEMTLRLRASDAAGEDAHRRSGLSEHRPPGMPAADQPASASRAALREAPSQHETRLFLDPREATPSRQPSMPPAPGLAEPRALHTLRQHQAVEAGSPRAAAGEPSPAAPVVVATGEGASLKASFIAAARRARGWMSEPEAAPSPAAEGNDRPYMPPPSVRDILTGEPEKASRPADDIARRPAEPQPLAALSPADEHRPTARPEDVKTITVVRSVAAEQIAVEMRPAPGGKPAMGGAPADQPRLPETGTEPPPATRQTSTDERAAQLPPPRFITGGAPGAGATERPGQRTAAQMVGDAALARGMQPQRPGSPVSVNSPIERLRKGFARKHGLGFWLGSFAIAAAATPLAVALIPASQSPRPAGADITGSISPGSDAGKARERVPAAAVASPPASTPASGSQANAPAGAAATASSSPLAADPGAVYEVGDQLVEQRGSPRELKLAASILEKAAEKGLAPAQYRLGRLYEKGLGVDRDIALAKAWYERAARQGNVKAMHNLAVLYANGADGKPEYGAAAKWFRDAASYGLRDSQFNLGVLLARGLGTQRNAAEAYRWFSIAAAQGDAEAARKRDEVGRGLKAADLRAAQEAAAAWRPAPYNRAANEAPSDAPQAATTPPPGQRASAEPR